MSVSFIIPTFNEKDNIIKLINNISIYIKKITKDYEIIVIDDSSPDNTGEICNRYYQNNKNVKTFIRKNIKGFASAIYFGIKKAKKDYIIVMDADFSHDPKLIPVMLHKAKKYDIVLGSRYTKNGGGENKQRFWLSKIYNIYLKVLLKIDITDFLFGYFCVRKDYLIKNKLLDKHIFVGFGDYFIRFAYSISKSGGSFYEISAFYKNRMYGESKSNLIKMLFTYTITSLEIFKLKYFHH